MAAKNVRNGERDNKETYTFFWRKDSVFSQWHSCRFTEKGVVYNCTEQYMMHQKALLFGDDAIAAKIMATDDPKSQKELGRAVSNFNASKWDKKCREIVKQGNLAKFGQNEGLWKEMAKTAGTILVEASPMDRIWGIGLAGNNPKALNKATWRGKNWLGYTLTTVRTELQAMKDGQTTTAAQGTAGAQEQMSIVTDLGGASVTSVERESYTFFWRKESVFSQWYPCRFTVDGVVYNCAEQYMMHKKALMFGDHAIAERIMATDNPKKMKAHGRKVGNFNAEVWDKQCQDVVKKGNLAKFAQNEQLRKEMEATKGTVLVEASPMDQIWGIGLAADNPKALTKATWRGKNLLGYTLTAVRTALLAD